MICTRFRSNALRMEAVGLRWQLGLVGDGCQALRSGVYGLYVG